MIVKPGQKVQLNDGRIIHVRDAVDVTDENVKANPDDIFMGHVCVRDEESNSWTHNLRDRGIFYFSDVVAVVEGALV